MTAKIKIFTNQTTNDSSIAFVPTGDGLPGQKLETLIIIYGVFAGASLQLEFLKDGGGATVDADWYSTGDDPITSSGAFFTKLGSNIPYRFTMTSAGMTTDISITVFNAELYPF